MARSQNITALLSLNFFIISLFLTQIQATNSQTITELTNTNRNIPVPESHPSTTHGEEEQEPVFVRDTGHGYGLYGHHTSHTNNEEDNSNENDYNDQFYYRSDAFGNRNGRF
ncbi:Uncharacterized protein HA466_0205580 [Hirschfeldia incana]|nr:Uncharacterized protein HA466_0205580 [Hirschfeldia incana]